MNKLLVYLIFSILSIAILLSSIPTYLALGLLVFLFIVLCLITTPMSFNVFGYIYSCALLSVLLKVTFFKKSDILNVIFISACICSIVGILRLSFRFIIFKVTKKNMRLKHE